MEFYDIPQGNGQKIYVDPRWVTKEVADYLSEKCYDIITDSALATDDIFFFTPCLDEHINNVKEDYVGKKMKKLRECFIGEDVNEPLTLTFPEDSFIEELPALPFVLKNINENGGQEKFIIRTPEQVEILKRFYQEGDDYDFECRVKQCQKEWACLGKLTFDKTGHSDKGICFIPAKYSEEFHKNMVIQEYISTPTKYNTSMRVLTSSTGDILCASLKYMKPSTEPEKKYFGYFDTYLSDPSSPYYLGSESIISNTVAGGNSILLGRDSYNTTEQEVLSAHDIDPNNAQVPESVRRVALKIAVTCKREIGAISGMDFIYDEKTRTWKFLEQHEFPMLTSYAEANNMTIPEDHIEEYIFHRDLDFNVRLHALTIFMKRKQPPKEDIKKLQKIG